MKQKTHSFYVEDVELDEVCFMTMAFMGYCVIGGRRKIKRLCVFIYINKDVHWNWIEHFYDFKESKRKEGILESSA